MALEIAGHATSWGHLVVTADTMRLSGFTGLSFTDAITEALGYGLGLAQAPTRRSIGKYEAGECKLTGFAADVQQLIEQLAARGGGSLSPVEFVITANFAFLLGEPPKTVVLKRCRVLNISDSYSDGSDLLMTDLSIKPMSILRNGISLHLNAPGL